MRTQLSDARLDEIVREVEATQLAAEDEAMRQKMRGERCFSCDTWLGLPSGTTRYCSDCYGDVVRR
jgi:hypothetical protein